LEPVVQGLTKEPEDAAYADVEDATRVIVEWFNHEPNDA
jgi:hypothetical protein